MVTGPKQKASTLPYTLIHQSAWEVHTPNFGFTAFSEGQAAPPPPPGFIFFSQLLDT
jgi:hypothetical protein